MRDPQRISEVLACVEELWRLHPDWRQGQLVSNVATWADPTRDVVWDLEDDQLVEEIHRHFLQAATSVAG